MLTPLEYLCERLRILCDMTGTTYNQIEEFIGIGKNTITNWPKYKSLPASEKILGIATFFDVSVDYLLGNTDNPKSHKDSNKLACEFVDLLKQLSEATQGVRNYLCGYLMMPKQNNDDSSEKVMKSTINEKADTD